MKNSLCYRCSDQEFIEIIAQSTSVCDALRRLGYRTVTSGGARQILQRRCDELGISLPVASNPTAAATEKNRLPNNEFFAINTNRKGTDLRKRLLDLQLVPHQCAICGLKPEWNGQFLTLQVDHINGDHFDNRVENLRLLCPNCHSQTETYGRKNVK